MDCLGGNTDALPEHEIVRDHKCKIGEWLHRDGLKFAHLPEFQTVKRRHKKIHDIAAVAWAVKKCDPEANLEPFLKQLDQAKHNLFMAWHKLNALIGELD